MIEFSGEAVTDNGTKKLGFSGEIEEVMRSRSLNWNITNLNLPKLLRYPYWRERCSYWVFPHLPFLRCCNEEPKGVKSNSTQSTTSPFYLLFLPWGVKKVGSQIFH